MRYLKERREVMHTAKEISNAKLVPGTWGNVSVRIEGESLMVITPSGMAYNTLTVEDMVLVDYEGQVAEGNWKPSVETLMHAEIYKSRPDINAIVHVHSLYSTVFAVARQNIPVVIEETAQVIGHEIEVASYAACGSKELATNTARTLGSHSAVLLANHGLVGVGKNVAAALKVCTVAERTAQIVLYAKQLGGVTPLLPADTAVLHEKFQHYGQEK